ncbi:MAG: hypothetical protein E7604_11015 [Ruminococcaceae bacterium]|nr:hypothetical protein [Oscillospiraceae bacterium]
MHTKTITTRLTAAALGAVMTFGACTMTSCKKQEAVKEKPTNVYRTDVLYENSFSYNDDVAGRTEFRSLEGIGNRLILCGYTYDENWMQTDLFYDVDTETGDLNGITVPSVNTENGEYRNYITFADDGTVWYTVNSGSYDEETGMYRENCSLYCADTDGNILSNADLYDLLDQNPDETYLYLNTLQISGDTALLSINEGVYAIDRAMTSAKEIKLDDMSYINTMIPCDGGVYVSYTTSSDYKQKIVRVDTASFTVSAPLDIPSTVTNYLYGAMASETYDIVYKTTTGLFGYDIASGTETELLNWINSDLNASNMNDTYITPDGTVYTLLQKYQSDGQTVQLLKMTRIPDEEVVEKYMLTYGCLYPDSEVLDAIIDFNRTSEEYRITVRDYSGYNSEENEWMGGVTQFNNDIISGKIPDIIHVTQEMSLSNYASKGLFADLRTFMENDPVFAPDDLYENILDAFSIGGKLYQIAPGFSVRTLAAKSSLVGDYDGWTMDELLASLNKLEPGTDPFGGEVTRNDFLNAICSAVRDQFIDPETGICSFSSPEFIKILEFAKTLPEKTYWETTNWEEIGEDFYIDQEMRFRENRALLYQLYLNNYTYFWETQEGMFGERISLVGYPNENRIGATVYPSTTFAVSSQSLCQEGAWAFISDYFADRKAANTDSIYQFSIFRSVNAKLAERALAYHDNFWYEQGAEDIIVEEVMPASVDEDMMVDPNNPYAGLENSEKTWTYWIGNQQINIGMMTEEAVARVDAFLESLSQCYQYDDAMMDIILEEASAFFSGQKSAEEIANLIQSRVSIYVAESR